MNRRVFAASTLVGAIGLLAGMQVVTAVAATPPGMENCYGINAAAKNDCAGGAHSCAGQATKARDAQSFVYVPVGVCGKIEGGSLKSG
jgi:uncharacterized membrane protein